MNLQVTHFARCQVHLALRDLRKKQDPEAEAFAKGLRTLLADPDVLPDRLLPLEGMAEVPHREIVLGNYRLFFRKKEHTLWFMGLWPPIYSDK